MDDSQAKFWTAFNHEGGIATLGFPVSNRYHFKGFLTQAFQKAILQWDSVRGHANFLNTLDELAVAGRDQELLVYRQTPQHVSLIEDSGLNPAIPKDFAQIVENHLRLLAQNPIIQERFLSEDRWLELYGLPISYIDFGPVQVFRAQRQVFQVWTVDGGGGPKNEPVLANTGDLAKEFGLLPDTAIEQVHANNPLKAEPTLSLSTSTPYQGEILVVDVHGISGPINVKLGETEFPAVCESENLRALVPISSVTEPGSYILNVTFSDELESIEIERIISIQGTNYPSTQIHLPADLTTLLNPETVEAERVILNTVFGGFTRKRLWDGAFAVPAYGNPTSLFGERRSFDASGTDDYHRGHDIAASIGTPVKAAQHGVVVLAEPLHVRGNTVVMDHGRGVYSAYLHLSSINVTVGDLLETGDKLGAVGNTGLSTGPHLHWEIRVLNVPVNPLQWTWPGTLTE